MDCTSSGRSGGARLPLCLYAITYSRDCSLVHDMNCSLQGQSTNDLKARRVAHGWLSSRQVASGSRTSLYQDISGGCFKTTRWTTIQARRVAYQLGDFGEGALAKRNSPYVSTLSPTVADMKGSLACSSRIAFEDRRVAHQLGD